MPRSKSLTLGIDIHDEEIRVVLVDATDGTPSVCASNVAALPEGAIRSGVVADPDTVAQALRRLVEPLRVTQTTRTIVGIPSALANTRLLSIPHCDDREIPTLVEGEMEHLGLDGRVDPQEIFPFARRADGLSGGMRTVAVISVDPEIVRSVADAVERAGLTIAAIETSQIAKLRTATRALPLSSATFFLILGPYLTGVTYFNGSELVASRRIEIGSSHLVRTQPSGHASEGALTPMRVDHAAIDRLAIESLQMMEFVQRDYAEEIESVRIYAIEPELEMLAPMLERRFGLPTTFSPPPTELGDVRFSVAYGLAVRDLQGAFDVPTIDLLASHRNRTYARETKRNLVGAFLASGLALAVGLGGTVSYGRLIALLDKHAHEASTQLAIVQKQSDSARSSREKSDRLYRILRHEGVPLGGIIDYVAESVDPDVRLKSVVVGQDLNVRIQGEARTEAAIGRTTQRLQTSPILTHVGLGTLDRSIAPADAMLAFEIDAATVAADRVRLEVRR